MDIIHVKFKELTIEIANGLNKGNHFPANPYTPYGRQVVSITQLKNIGRYPNNFRAAVQSSFEEDSYHK